MKDIYAFEPIWENWVIDEFLGSGSYGSVYKAHREDQFSHAKQYAAVKHISIPKQDGTGENDIPFPSEEARSQYYRNMLNQLIIEIDAMISLRGKPNIVSYEEHKVVPKEHNSGYDLFLRMELLTSISDYCPFKEYIKHPLPRNQVIQLGIDIATALETLENRNLVHRDIKPDNIFIDDEGHFKLGDFGTARVLEVTGNASTKTGTPNYMAPEVYTKLIRYDQTVDIYSLGIMLYRYMNDGYLPFMSATALEADVALTRRIQGESIEPPCNADDAFSKIILKACAYKAEDRYQNAQELKQALIKYKEQKIKEVEIPIVCLLDDGQEIFRSYKNAKSSSQVKVTTDDIPYKKFVSEDKELISSREIVIQVDENGRFNPSEAVFTLRDCKTLFAVSVQIICRDENYNEILVQKTECFYQSHNLVRAPSIAGYSPVGQTEVEVEVLHNRTTRPPQVVFQYKKESVVSQTLDITEPAECEIPVLCILENGEEILNSKRTCRENASNIITAPEITGYVLIGDDSRKISVSHSGNAEPDKVVFTYRRMKSGKQETTIAIICRDDYGNELKRDSAVINAGQALQFTAPVIKGYKLINEDKKAVELIADDKGVPSQSEILFIYEKENKKKLAIIGIIVALLLVSTGVGFWFLNRPIQKYTITWKHEDGSVLELDQDVPSDSIPEYNGSEPQKPEDDQYTYSFTGWTPSIKPVKADEVYVAEFEKIEKDDDRPIQKYTITWKHEDGSILEKDEDVPSDSIPEYNGSEPQKSEDDQYTYTFTGWTPSIKPVIADEVYVAEFEKKEKEKEFPTEPVENETVTENITDSPTEEPEIETTPANSSDETSDTGTVQVNITDNTTETPVPMFTITWQDDTGKTIDSSKVPYGTELAHEPPAKEADQEYIYTFSMWEPAVEKVTGDATYKAVFITEPRYYTITWQDDTGKAIDSSKVPYGTELSHDPLTKEADQKYTYTFSGWEPAVEKVTGDATYKAVFHIDHWICSYCHAAANTFDDYFCTNCAQTKLCLECGHCVPKDDKYCSNCGTEVGKWICWECRELADKDDLFCIKCGTKRHMPGTQQ